MTLDWISQSALGCPHKKYYENFSDVAPSRDAMARNHRIVVTEEDYSLLRRLAGHPRLAAELKLADVVDSDSVPPDVVTMNSRVLFEYETTGERREVTIVFPQQADA